jgi:hypothetical protein
MGMERALYIRESNDGLYRPIIYLVYKFLDELLLMLPVTSATTATVFLACRLQGSFLLFWLVNFVTLANGTGMCSFPPSLPALAWRCWRPEMVHCWQLYLQAQQHRLLCCGYKWVTQRFPASSSGN